MNKINVINKYKNILIIIFNIIKNLKIDKLLIIC